MSISKYGSIKFTGSHPSKLPDGDGDLFYEQDRIRDFAWAMDRIGILATDLKGTVPILVSGGVVTKGTGETVSVTAGVGYAPWTVALGNDAAVPPATVDEDISAVRIAWTAQSDIGTFSGTATYYVKVKYAETEGSLRTRQKAGGTWYFTKVPSFTFVIDTSAPTAYEVLLARVTVTSGVVGQILLEPPSSGSVSKGPLGLPLNPVAGMSLDLVMDVPGVQILQTDAEHVISHRNWLFTTKGTAGFLQLKFADRVKLTYKGNGFARQAPLKISDPTSLPTGIAQGVSWSPNGRYLAIGHITTPFVTIYDWSTGSPVKMADPATLPGGTVGYGTAWSPDGRYLAVTSNGFPFVTFYDMSSGVPVKITDPATSPANASYGVSWSPDGRYSAIGHLTTPFVTIYDWSSGAPVKIADPASLPPSSYCGTPGWSPDGRYLAVPGVGSPYVTIYDWITGVPIKITNPVTIPTGPGKTAVWSPDNRYLVVSHDTTPWVTIYDFITNIPVKISNPVTIPTGIGNGAAWSFDNRYLAIAHAVTPFVTIYDCLTSGVIKITNPLTLPAAAGYQAAFSPDNRYLAIAHDTTPFVTIYDLFAAATKVWNIEIDGMWESRGIAQTDDLRFRFK